MELPEFEHSETMIEAVRRTSRHLSASRLISYRRQQRRLTERGYSTSEDTISKFAAGLTRPVDLDSFAPALWAMLAEEHGSELQTILREVTAENLVRRDPVTNALHQFWLPGATFDHEKLAQLRGSYAAFAPFFLDPAAIQLMALDCGLDDDPGRFRLEMRYTDDSGRERRDRIEGVIIPCGENIMFIGEIVGQLTPYIFVLSSLPINNGLVERGEGTTLVASRAARPSASPLLIVRRDARPKPRVLESEGDQKSVPEWRAIEKVMARGYVSWQ
jgi:hypothetical protein